MFFEESKLRRINNFLLVFGILYSVVWTFIVYFIWEDSPKIFTVLDALTDIVLVHMVFVILKRGRFRISRIMALRQAQLFSLIYATIWTVAIMLTLELDIGEMLLPLDFISLYATITLSWLLLKNLGISE